MLKRQWKKVNKNSTSKKHYKPKDLFVDCKRLHLNSLPLLHECTGYCNMEQMIGLGSSPCACSPFPDAPHPLAGNTLLQKLPEMQENRFS
jgi:hypothetical protein